MNGKQFIGTNNLFPLVLLTTFTVLLVWRAPNLLIAPRFWAEEGSIYFQFAYEHNLAEMLCFVYWRCGYLNLIVNISTAIATWVSLEYAPAITTYTAFVIQVIPITIVLFGKSAVFEGIVKKILGCSILLFAPTIPGEVWLNTLNSQIYFGLIAMLILVEDLEDASNIWRWAYRLLLLVGGLSGVYVCFLQPVFMFRAFVERKKEHYVQLAIVTLALLLQLGLFLVSIFLNMLNEKRSVNLGLHTLADISLYHIGLPLFGREVITKSIEVLGPVGSYAFLVLLLILLPYILFLSIRQRGWSLTLADSRMILTLALFMLMITTSLTAFQGKPIGRYAVLSGFAILLLILDSVRMSEHTVLSIAFTSVLIISQFSGALGYRADSAFQCDGESPNAWKAEVEKWRQCPEHEILICPQPWKLQIRPKT